VTRTCGGGGGAAGLCPDTCRCSLSLRPTPGNRSGAARSGTLCLDLWGEVRRKDPRVPVRVPPRQRKAMRSTPSAVTLLATPPQERRACASDRAHGRALHMLSRCACRPPTGLARRSGEDDDIGRSERDVGRSARRAAPPSAEARVELLSFLRCRSTLSCENVCSWGCGVLGRRTACGAGLFSTGDKGVLRSWGADREASTEPVVHGACCHRC